MQKTFLIILVSLVFLGCQQMTERKGLTKDTLFFRTQISPAFDEGADIMLSKFNTIKTIKFTLTEAHGDDKPVGVFYDKTMTLSNEEFNKLDLGLFKEMINSYSIKRIVRDGVGFQYTLVNNRDTSVLSFSSPSSATDTAAFKLIENSFSNFRSIFKDSIINEYLDDIEIYIDYSKRNVIPQSNRAISRLRKLKYHY